MSKEIDLCRDSGDDNVEWPNVPSLPLSVKRPREKEDSPNAHLRNDNGPGNKTATGSAEFCVDLELADAVEESPHKKRRGAVRSERSGKNDAVEKCGQTPRGLEATEKAVGCEDAQAADHRESREGVAAGAGASRQMNSDSKQSSRDDGSANKHFPQLSTLKPSSVASARQGSGKHSIWGDHLSELADYRKIHGHCNVPQRYSENKKLGEWVATQRKLYKSHFRGKASRIIPFRIQALESLGFEWVICDTEATEKAVGCEDAQAADHRESREGVAAGAGASQQMNSDSKKQSRRDEWGSHSASWEDRLSELADYRKIHGHCNVPNNNYSLGKWVATQRTHYRLHLEGKKSSMTNLRIQELESLGFDWVSHCAAWEFRLSELADYRKIHGHCIVPKNYSENTRLGQWVAHQRCQYRLHLEGKTSQMTLPRIQELESLGFEWEWHSPGTTWEDHLSELADYRKIHGHCNVTQRYSENSRLGQWVGTQRHLYRLHLEGKTSQMILPRIQALENLGFEWEWHYPGTTWGDRLGELAEYRKIHGHCNVPISYKENAKLARWVATQRRQYRLHLEGKISPMTTYRIQALESLDFEWGSRGAAWEVRLSELANYRKIHGRCNVPHDYLENSQLARWVENQRKQYNLHQEGKKSSMTLSRIQALESLDFEWKASIGRGNGTRKKPSLDDNARRPHNKSANSRQDADSPLETALFNEGFRATGYH
jgi:hypothetical protein